MYGYYSILECYNLFAGVKLSLRSFCLISVYINVFLLIKFPEQLIELCFYFKYSISYKVS